MKSMVITREAALKLTPWIGGALWSTVSLGLTVAGVNQIPEREYIAGIVIYAIGVIPGVYALRKLARANHTRLLHAKESLSLWDIFLPRFWLMMVTMMMIGQLLRILDAHPWVQIIFYLPSASALLCGAVAFFTIGITTAYQNNQRR